MVNIFPAQVADNLWILGNDYFHIYLIKGCDACALVETGISATADVLLEQLARIGAKPDFLIVSHPHSDHITGLDPLRKSFPHATVVAGMGADSFVSHPKAEQPMILEDSYMTESLAVRGLVSQRPPISSVPSLSGWRIINGSEELCLGGVSASIMEVKGHSPGNIAVYVPGIKAALVSDSLGNHYPGRGFFPTFFTGFADYLETINNLEKIDPLILGLAHNGIFSKREDIKNIFSLALKSAVDLKTYIVNDQRNDEDIAQDIFGFYYNDELKIYSPQNILNCCRLLVRRIRE
jgi:2-aminobenzoylacetyl-CoA thioesterase